MALPGSFIAKYDAPTLFRQSSFYASFTCASLCLFDSEKNPFPLPYRYLYLSNPSTTDIHQKNDLAARIARAAAVFCVDEIVVFDDAPSTIPPKLRARGKKTMTKMEALATVADHEEPWENPDQFLYHLLSFLECPGHLRRHLFSEHPNLKSAGKLPTLDMPHHMKKDEWCQYREGAVVDPTAMGPSTRPIMTRGFSLVECGLPHLIKLPYDIPVGTRVTLKFGSSEPPASWPDLSADDFADLEVEATSQDEPRTQGGYYWGFSIRKAKGISDVFSESPYLEDEGYDVNIGTSERGLPLNSIFPDPTSSSARSTPATEGFDGKLPENFKHLLLVFGGVQGLEPAVASDPALDLTKETAHELFDLWVNLVPGQGSRTIRTEEAVWIGLMGMRDYVVNNS